MPRPTRSGLVDVPHHVIQRGNNRGCTFVSDADRSFYLAMLRQYALQTRCEVHAYVLMTNHVHLLVTPRAVHGISRLMQHLGRKYVLNYNRHHQRTGTLWEGRHWEEPVLSMAYAMHCQRYIDLNPVRAGIAAHPASYRWSSFRWLGLGERDELVTPHETYLALGEGPEERRSTYRNLCSLGIEEEVLDALRKGHRKRGRPSREQA